MEENLPGLLIFIDFLKAFDSLEWNFLLRYLESFNSGSVSFDGFSHRTWLGSDSAGQGFQLISALWPARLNRR